MTDFDGATYDPSIDRDRLTSQLTRVASIMWDGQWHTLAELSKRASYQPHAKASEAAVSARLRDLRKPRFGGYTIERRRAAGGGLYEYRLVVPDHLKQQNLPLGEPNGKPATAQP